MRSSQGLLRGLPLLLPLLLASPLRAQPVRLVSADENGATLRVELPAWSLGPADRDGRQELRATGLAMRDVEGRPQLPHALALLAVPPGARVSARIVGGSAEEVKDGVRVRIAGRPAWKGDPGGLGAISTVEPVPPILDGPWPTQPVEAQEPFTLRRQTIVAVRVQPFRYDEASHRLWVRRTLDVRVDFEGGDRPRALAAEDRHWEPVLRHALLNYEQGRAWRKPLAVAKTTLLPKPVAGTSGAQRAAAFDESDPEVRIQIDTTGVYGLDFDELAPKGYPTGVPIAEVSLHRHEFVPDASPPYVTIELPIDVDDANGNGVFDSGDRIVAYVQSWAERSGATKPQREWGDAEVVYATRLAGGGLRYPTAPSWRGATGLVPLASYPWTQRWERSFSYFGVPDPNDSLTADRFLWTFTLQYYNRPDSIRFEANQLDTTRQILFRSQYQGTNDGFHFVWAQVKNAAGQFTSVVDSVNWIGRHPLLVTTPITGSALSEGITNTFRAWGKGNFAPPDPLTNVVANASLDWFEATYWRRYRALRGMLVMNSGDAAGEFQIHAAGFFSPNLRLYDVTDPANPVKRTIDPSRIVSESGLFAFDFQDSTATGSPRRYIAFDEPKAVPTENYRSVSRRALTNRSVGDYLLIVPEAFLPQVAPLVARRAAQQLDVVVAPLESVNDEFNGGRRSKHAIKRFVKYAYEHWQARFVLLVGDGSQDGRHLLGESAVDWIPVPLVPGPVRAPSGGFEMIASDPWYGWCLNDDPSCWNQPFAEPDLFVGRLPVNSPQQTADFVTKLVQYENFADDPLWRRRMLLLADDAYSGQNTFGGSGQTLGYCFRDYELEFRSLNEVIRSVILDEAGLQRSEPEILDLRSYLVNPNLYVVGTFGDTCRTDPNDAEAIARATFTQPLKAKLSAGVAWWNYQGHANQYVLSHEGFWRNGGNSGIQDWQDLANLKRPFLFSAFSCHANGFAEAREGNLAIGPSLGENLVNAVDKGAIGSWASSGFEVIPRNGFYHLNVEMARSMYRNPPHDDLLANGDRGARVMLGPMIALTLANYLPSVAGSPYEAFVGLTYNLLGDPATEFTVGPPQILVTANGVSVVDGEPVRLGTTGDTLRLEADFVSNVELRSITLERTSGAGTVVVPDSEYTLTPAFPDVAGGGRRYHLSYFTNLGSNTFRYTLRTVDRYGVTATFEIVFEFQTVLLQNGQPVGPSDPVAPNAALSLLVLSPSTLNPATDLTLQIDGLPQPFTATAARGDTTGRAWILSWTHTPYAAGGHDVVLELNGSPAATHRFTVVGGLRFANAMAFPNPFEESLGTQFSFTLESDAAADLLIRVYTASGRLLFERTERGLLPGYHQIPWDGKDAEGHAIANGVYFYRMLAHTPSGSTFHEGRLVKLRKPRRAPEETAANP